MYFFDSNIKGYIRSLCIAYTSPKRGEELELAIKQVVKRRIERVTQPYRFPTFEYVARLFEISYITTAFTVLSAIRKFGDDPRITPLGMAMRFPWQWNETIWPLFRTPVSTALRCPWFPPRETNAWRGDHRVCFGCGECV